MIKNNESAEASGLRACRDLRAVACLPVTCLPVTNKQTPPLPIPSGSGRGAVGGSEPVVPSRGPQLVVLKRSKNVPEKTLIF